MARDSGELTLVSTVAATENPSFVLPTPDGRALYAVNEVATYAGEASGAVSAFARDRGPTAALRPLGQRSSHGAAPCYLSFDRAGRFLLVANYGGGSVSVLPILDGGALGEATSHVQHEGHGADPKRQAAPHAHCIVAAPDNRFVLVADLGLDAVLVYAFDARAGTLSRTPVARGALAPGAGPRHLVFHPGGRAVYVTNELDSTVTTLRYDPASGALDALQTVPTLAEPFAGRNAPADVHLHPSGRFLYLSNRGHDSIAAFAIDPATFTLRLLETLPTEGAWPRNFALDPSGRFLLVANQRADSVVVLRVDGDTGRLASTGQRLEIPAPTCLRFADEAGGAWR
jgi:6-phosphogluconolactonase